MKMSGQRLAPAVEAGCAQSRSRCFGGDNNPVSAAIRTLDRSDHSTVITPTTPYLLTAQCSCATVCY